MKKNLMWITLVVTLLLTACGGTASNTTPTLSADAIYTAAAQTVSAQLTAAATQFVPTATNTVEPTATATMTAIPTIAPLFTSTSAVVLPTVASGSTGTVCDKALFVTDVTIPDGTKMDLNEAFTKTWQLKNAGTCTWTTDYALVFYDGKQMTDEDSIYLDDTVAPNSTVDVSVKLTAPDSEGTYKGTWVLQNSAGLQISPTFYVEIKVNDGVADYDDASVTISDYTVGSGDQITAYVSDFPADEDIDYCIRLKSESDCEKRKDGHTDSDGDDSATFTLPSGADSGSYWVVEVSTTEQATKTTVVSDKIIIN